MAAASGALASQVQKLKERVLEGNLTIIPLETIRDLSTAEQARVRESGLMPGFVVNCGCTPNTCNNLEGRDESCTIHGLRTRGTEYNYKPLCGNSLGIER